MIKNKMLAVAVSALLTLSLASNANQPDTVPAVAPETITAVKNINMIDPNYWMNAFTAPDQPPISNEITFNAANPGAWMQWVNPGTHMATHKPFMNPASYTQFMRSRFYMEFMKPENMMAWMNPASYQVLTDPQTMNYWMNPGSYTHVADPAMYQETMNPSNYMVYLNPATYAGLMGAQTCDPQNPNKTPGWFGFGC
jgi:hypothetical protein